MTPSSSKSILLLLILITLGAKAVSGQNAALAQVSGSLSLDDSWEPVIYLSHIPIFEEMHYMSNKMIIAKAEIDSLGYFEFKLDFLPEEEQLYRLHVVKKEDTPATLIIGGKDENHIFLLLNRHAKVQLSTHSPFSPFKNITYSNSEQNSALQQISQIVYQSDSIASKSSASKRSLLEQQLHADLITIADTSNHFLVSLFAIYKSKFESNYEADLAFYKSYLKKWKKQDNTYFNSFAQKLPIKRSNDLLLTLLLAVALSILAFFLGKISFDKNRKLKKLSVQERKVYALLQQSASNQEIANQLNIGLSTAKSHVSSIYAKLNVKSRKDIINMK